MRLLPVLLRTSVACTLAAGLLVADIEAGTAGSAESVAAAAYADPAPTASVDLQGDTVAPERSVRRGVRTWKKRKLRYYETLPATWDWSLSTAVAKWNGAGGSITLVRTPVRRRADLVISFGSTGGVAAQATVGSVKDAYVRLSSSYDRVDALAAHNRVAVMNILAHELGHVFGFQHTPAPCSLMQPSLDVAGCNLVPASMPGFYKCRTIDAPLVTRFVKAYGGKARYPGTWCLIDPLPPTLTGVGFSGGGVGGAPVAVRWQPPSSAPPGSRIQIRTWSTTGCGTPPPSATTVYVPVSAGRWQRDNHTPSGSECFQVQLVNRYGAGRTAVARVVSWSPVPIPVPIPPPAPVLGTPVWDPVAVRFHAPVSHRAGTRLVYHVASPDPLTCPGDYSDLDLPSVVEDAGRWGEGIGEFEAVRPHNCVSVYALDDVTGLASPPAQVVFDAPLPRETPQVTGFSQDQRSHPLYRAIVIGAGPGEKIAYSTATGPCPTTAPADARWSTVQMDGLAPQGLPPQFKDAFQFISPGAGTNCEMFRVVDSFDFTTTIPGKVIERDGPVVMHEWVDDGPLPPYIGPVSWNESLGRFEGSADFGGSLRAAYDPENPTVCPEPEQLGTSLLDLGHPGHNQPYSFTPPAAEVCVSFFTIGDMLSKTGISKPTTRVFVVPGSQR